MPLLCAHPKDKWLGLADWQLFLEIQSMATFHRELLTQIESELESVKVVCELAQKNDRDSCIRSINQSDPLIMLLLF